MSEEFWWRHCGFFYEAAKRSQLVQNVHSGFFRSLATLRLPAGTMRQMCDFYALSLGRKRTADGGSELSVALCQDSCHDDGPGQH